MHYLALRYALIQIGTEDKSLQLSNFTDGQGNLGAEHL